MPAYPTVRFPQQDKDVVQDAEYCEVVQGAGEVIRVRFHDYAQVFNVPGLYDRLFGGPDSMTKCISPQVLVGLLGEHLHHVCASATVSAAGSEAGTAHHDGIPQPTPARLHVLDFGAGNGMMAEEIRGLFGGCRARSFTASIVGFDILAEAKLAAERDRPGVYDEYIVADIIRYVDRSLKTPEYDQPNIGGGFDVLVSASALMFGDAPAQAFKAAVSLTRNGGLVLFNLNERFFDVKGFVVRHEAPQNGTERVESSRLVSNALWEAGLRILATKRYCHRLSVTGKELYYVAVVALKQEGSS